MVCRQKAGNGNQLTASRTGRAAVASATGKSIELFAADLCTSGLGAAFERVASIAQIYSAQAKSQRQSHSYQLPAPRDFPTLVEAKNWKAKMAIVSGSTAKEIKLCVRLWL